MFTEVIDSLESSIDSTIASFSIVFSIVFLGEGFKGRAGGVLNIAFLFSFLLEVLSKFSLSLTKNIINLRHFEKYLS
jgi:hypothetical protein